ncbi:MAG: heme o synthase [Thermomicrobiales bacterium]|nr:heme o synthase [Thermomicrobiales bacterium]
MTSNSSSPPLDTPLQASTLTDHAAPVEGGTSEQTGILATVNDYVMLMKPGILSLLLVTMLAGMMFAAKGFPSFTIVFWGLLGGLLSAGGANVLNCYIDRDIDRLMTRTKHRASASGRIAARNVLIFGLVLTAASALILGVFTNWFTAGLALIGCFYYVVVYTYYLKRRTEQNIVIGGAAGAMPPVVGWAAVSGSIGIAPVLMFALIYYWTPPHSWALALLKRGDYSRADVPMLPVIQGEMETRRQILLYSLLMVAVSFLLTPFGLGEIYFVSAIALNAIFMVLVVQLYRTGSKHFARLTFFYSLWYLALIFAAMVVDRMVLGN